MHKSTLTFGLLASSLVMLAVMPFFNSNYGKQWHKDMITMEIVLIANTQQTTKNMNVRTGPLEGFLVSLVEFCKGVQVGDKDEIEKINRV